MEKLDRLGWAAGISVLAYGVRVGVRVNVPEALSFLPNLLPPSWKPSRSSKVGRLYSFIMAEPEKPRGRRVHLLFGDLLPLARSRDLTVALDALESDMHRYVAEWAPRRLFVHAGVVGWKGRAILIPGRSFSGKSTLVAELIRAGATYYSDEYAVLDGDGMVHPFSRPLGLRTTGDGKTGRHRVEAFGSRAGVKPLPVGLVLVSRYRAGARFTPRRATAGQGALDLLANAVSVRRQPGATLAALRRAVSEATVLRGARGEAAEVATRLLLEQRV